jgi:hypothetical protein
MIDTSHCRACLVTKIPAGEVVWSRHDLSSAPLNYRGHLRFLQGAPLTSLFLPFLLLKGTPAPVWRVPFELHDVVLAEIHEAPQGVPMDVVAFELMKIALTPA